MAAPTDAVSTTDATTNSTPRATAKGPRDQDGRTLQVVSFRLGAEEYGVDIMTVQEIILIGCITLVPEAPEHVLGVINLRGNVIPILNLRRRLSMPDQATTESTRIVVMDLRGCTVGVVVDGVNEVLRLSHEDITPTPPSLAGVAKDYVTGLARRKDRLLVLLDMAALLLGGALAKATNTANGGR